MLADLISRHNIPNVSPYFSDDVKRAEKFVLEDNTYEALVQVSEWSVDALFTSLSLCRLPHALTWIECTRGPPAFLKEMEKDGHIVSKCGVLVQAADAEQKSLIGIMAWSYKNKNAIALSHIGVQINIEDDFDMKMEEDGSFNVRLNELQKSGLSTWDGRAPNRLGMRSAFGVNPYTTCDIKGDLMDDAISSWITRWIIAALALLNSRNLVVKTPADLTRLNHARTKRGELPLLSYSTVRITLNKRDARVAAEHGLSSAEIRRHAVRGHFKIKKHGIYWWRPFLRGNPMVGEVKHHSYEVTR